MGKAAYHPNELHGAEGAPILLVDLGLLKANASLKALVSARLRALSLGLDPTAVGLQHQHGLCFAASGFHHAGASPVDLKTRFKPLTHPENGV